jgi:SAM-dependent methyltransferase
MDWSYSRQYHDLWKNHWWWEARHRVIMGKLAKLLAGGGGDRPVLLDIGCGGGWAFDDFSGLADVYGLEPDPQLAASLPRWRSRITCLPFGPDVPPVRQYDAVLMLDVLEHIADDAGTLANLHQYLKPGGCLLLTVPALPRLWSVHDEINHHFRRYTFAGLRELALGEGFRIEELRYLFGWSLGLLFARRWLGGKRASYGVRIPPAWVNATCRTLSRLEEKIGGPWLGSSLLAVLRRPDDGVVKKAA